MTEPSELRENYKRATETLLIDDPDGRFAATQAAFAIGILLGFGCPACAATVNHLLRIAYPQQARPTPFGVDWTDPGA
jgi:hypothetical protein